MLDTLVSSANAAGVKILSPIKRKGKGLVRRTMLVLGTVMVLLVGAGGVALGTGHCSYSSSTGWNCYCDPGAARCEGTDKAENIWG